MSYFHGVGADIEIGPVEMIGAGFTMRSGVAIPLTSSVLTAFQNLQRAINAINAKQGRALIGVDGRIGEKTADALSSIVWTNSTDPWANTKVNPLYVAENAGAIASELTSLMGRIGASYVADPSTSSQPSTVKPDGTINNPPDGPSTTTIVIAAVAIGGVIALATRKRRKR